MLWRIGAMLLVFGFLFAPQLAAWGEGGASFGSAVTVEMGDRALGVYEFTVAYDPSDVEIESISGAGPFADNTFSNPSTYKSGRTKFLAFQSSSLREPTGSVQVANILWKKTGQGASAPTAHIAGGMISDTSGKLVPIAQANMIVASKPVEKETPKPENPSNGPDIPPPDTGNNPDTGHRTGGDTTSPDESPGDNTPSTPSSFVTGWGCSRLFQ